jgi:hypothetical protein
MRGDKFFFWCHIKWLYSSRIKKMTIFKQYTRTVISTTLACRLLSERQQSALNKNELDGVNEENQARVDINSSVNTGLNQLSKAELIAMLQRTKKGALRVEKKKVSLIKHPLTTLKGVSTVGTNEAYIDNVDNAILHLTASRSPTGGISPLNTTVGAMMPHTEATSGKDTSSCTENNQAVVKPQGPTIKTIMSDIKSLLGSKILLLSDGANKTDSTQTGAQANNA